MFIYTISASPNRYYTENSRWVPLVIIIVIIDLARAINEPSVSILVLKAIKFKLIT